ncbi:MAG: transcriptional regulator [Rhodanobacter sp.]
MNTQAIEKAITVAGGQTALARAINVSQGLVWQWCNGRLKVPAERCQGIEQATEGAVTRYDLRPDVFGEAPVKTGEAA